MPGRRWIILAVLFAARAATGFQFQSVGSAAKMLMQDLAIDYSAIGMLLGAYLLPGVIVAFPAGLLGQRFREKKLGLAGLALMAISGRVLPSHLWRARLAASVRRLWFWLRPR